MNGKWLDIVIFEGWCLGYRALTEAQICDHWTESCEYKDPYSRLWKHRLEDLIWVNKQLANYDVLTNALDAFIYIDVWDLQFVYRWRQEAEAKMRAENNGQGMTDDEVIDFVNGYYTSYELYREGLRGTVFKSPEQENSYIPGTKRFLSFVVNANRRVVSASEF